MQIKDQISGIFRCIEDEVGTTKLAKLVLENIIDCFETFKPKSIDDFYNQFRELLIVIKNTKPRLGIVIFYMCEIWDYLDANRSKFKTLDAIDKAVKKATQAMIAEIEKDSELVIKKGVTCIKNGDCILIHSHSQTVMKIIEKAKKSRKKFTVILAEQEHEKTIDMIKFLNEKNIKFFVVPEFMLSHIEDQVTKVFLGTVTFNDKYNFVTDSGTASVVSEFHGAKIPVYVFMTTKKYALWKSKNEHSHNQVAKLKSYESNPKSTNTYQHIKFSHDRINITSIDYAVTEEGIFNPSEIKNDFDTKFKKYSQWQKRHFSDLNLSE